MRNLRKQEIFQINRVREILQNLDFVLLVEVEEVWRFDGDVVPGVRWAVIQGLEDGFFKVLVPAC